MISRATDFLKSVARGCKLGDLKDVPNAEDDAAIASVSSPLIQEVPGSNNRVRNAEVSRVCEIEEVGAELQAVIFSNSRVLQNSKINVIDSV